MIVTSLMKIINLNGKSYVLSQDSSCNADILFVDSDDELAMKQVQIRKKSNSSIPVIITSTQDKKPANSDYYYLPKKKLGSQLIKILDEISVKHLKKIPVPVVSENIPTSIPTKTPEAPKKSSNEQSEKSRVLVIDDSLAVRTQMQIFLQNYSLNIDVAESAEKGIELASTTKYDLIFLDIVLPEMNGYKACKLLKLAPISFNTPVVMLTGKSSTFNKLRGVMAGCDQYLTKPVNGGQLLSVLKEYIPVLTKNKNTLRRT